MVYSNIESNIRYAVGGRVKYILGNAAEGSGYCYSVDVSGVCGVGLIETK